MFLLLVVLFQCQGAAINNNAQKDNMEASYLRCEYKQSPEGIDVIKPRLSWIVESPQRAQYQTAYRVIVASSTEKLAANQGDLWDSGKVSSDETTRIDYAGKPLNSHMQCFWKVKVWDVNGIESKWSEPAKWSMGLLGKWQGKWIGYDTKKSAIFTKNEAQQKSDLINDNWVWDAGSLKDGNVPKGKWYFRQKFNTAVDKLTSAKLTITADDHSIVFINGKSIGNTTAWNQVYTFDITTSIVQGENVIALEAQNGSEGPAGIIGNIILEFGTGDKTIVKLDSLVSSDSAKDGWTNLKYDDSSWKKVIVVAPYGKGPWGQIKSKDVILPPVSYLRKDFNTAKKVNRAMLYSSALGIYKVEINGKTAGDDYFAPGWTDYNKRVYYNAYDVTESIKSGNNAIGAVVADGWYSGYIGYGHNRDHYGNRTHFSAQLHIEYTDGSTNTILTDKSWKASTGPTVQADFLMGEKYDARLEIPGWSKSGFNDAAWQNVDQLNSIKSQIQAYPGVTVKVFQEIKPVKMHESSKGVYVYDFGTNFAGWAKLKIKGNKGDEIVIRYAEMLNPDGSVYTTNLRSARATDTYICKGTGSETWQPNFTFHGFQFLEIKGCSQKPDLNTVTGIELTSAAPVAGSFTCNDAQSNQLYKNICQTQRSNFIDIPTDCPQRDERLGWTGDAQVYIRTACLNNDTQAFFTKWLVDLNDGQRPDGQFPMVAPVKVAGDDGGPAWADAGVVCPWAVYQVYGDKQILEISYPSMKKFIAFCKNRCREGLVPPEKYHCFGDWLDINDPTSKDVIYMAYFTNSTSLTAKTARVLGKNDEAIKYEQLAKQIKESFNKNYIDQNGKIESDSQTSYVLAIAYDMVKGKRFDQAAKHLIRKIKSTNFHLSTGFVGTTDLMLALAKIGRNDIAYRLFHNDTFPSWGFPIKHGATSIWERWNGWTPDKGFGDPGMNSFAHYSFGAVGQWMFENIAGIKPAQPAYKQIIINPQLGTQITHASTSYDSIRGTVVSDWSINGNRFELKVTVPANTYATVYIPASNENDVLESASSARKAKGVTFIKLQNGKAIYKVESGSYTFSSKI